jgi:carbon monoxide dehydrogenase subunit G
MIEIERSIEVAASPERAFAIIARPERYPEWQPGVTEVVRTSDGPIGEGSTYRIGFAGPGGISVVAEGSVRVFRPPFELEAAAASKIVRLAGRYGIVRLDDERCRIDVSTRIEPLGMLRFAERMVRTELEREVPAALERLKAAIETEPI